MKSFLTPNSVVAVQPLSPAVSLMRKISLVSLSVAAVAAPCHAATFLVDFGEVVTPTTAGVSWNNVTPALGTTVGLAIDGLVSTDGVASDVDLVIVRRFNGPNPNGTLNSTAPYPTTATQDSLYGNTEEFTGLSNVFPSFRLTGLDLEQEYALTFYASRSGVGDNRETLYSVQGTAASSITLNAANNITQSATLFNVFPSETGEITISLSPGPANNNGNHFTYMGVLEVTAVPEPSSSLVAGLGGLLLLIRRRSR